MKTEFLLTTSYNIKQISDENKEEDQFGVWSISLLYFSFVTYEDKFVTHLINTYFHVK